MPSRERAELAKLSIGSLGDKVEVLVYVDNDDPQLKEYQKIDNITLVIGPRVGYKNFHKMINKLAEESTGDLLMLWNDDALMESSDWVETIENSNLDGLFVINFFEPRSPLLNLFPVIPRKLYGIMGHYSLSTHCDSWVQDMANKLNIHRMVEGIKARHIRDELFDQTKLETQNAYGVTSPEYSSPEMQEIWSKDVEKVRSNL